MGKWIKRIFYVYVIGLAIYSTVKNLSHRRFGRQQVSFIHPAKECFQGGADWRFCVYHSQLDAHGEILYLFHGKDQDENVWHDATTYAGLLQNYWQRKKMYHPKVVTISFGKVWLATPPLQKYPNPILPRIKDEVFFKVESHLGGRWQKRMLMGNSMGGLNAASVMLEYPELFNKVAILCPVIYRVSPHASIAELFAYARRTGAKLRSMVTTVGLGRKLTVDNEEWDKFSPYNRLLRMKPVSHAPKVYLTAGLRDRFGVYEPTEGFMRMLKERQFPVYWRPVSGDHCAIDVTSLGSFFHSVR